MELCGNLDPLRIEMPEQNKRCMRFKNYRLQLEAPFVIVARFESFRKPIYDMHEPTEGATVRERVHEPCAFAYHLISVDNSYPSQPVTFADPDPEIVMTEFLRRMEDESKRALAIMKEVKPMQYCDEGLKNHRGLKRKLSHLRRFVRARTECGPGARSRVRKNQGSSV
jgi:hypothetical protein